MKKIFRLSSIKEVLTIVVNKLKKNKKKVVIGLSVFLVVFISVFSFINLRYPTKINAYIAHVINKGRPANKYFDDENFYKAVVDAYNKENKTSLSYTTNLTDEQLKNIKSVSYSRYKKDSEKIKSATGIEKLTSLTSLDLCWNNLSSIDLSKNTSLTKLYLYQNNLSSIDLSKNTSLTNLDLDHNKISNIDLNKNIALTSLCLSFNSLSSIDLSKNTFLTTLYLDHNKISNIDLNKNTALTDLDSGNNKISNIDLNKNTSLTKLDLRYNSLSGIDLSKNTSLTKLDLYYNNLSSIDLSNNISLTSLELGNNKISNIDLNKNTSLTSLGLCENNLSSIDLNKNTSLTNLDLAHNKISSIDLSKNTSLTFLLFERNSLSSIDLSKNTSLTKLYLSSNKLSNIDLSKNTSLTILYFEWNSLSSIDLSKNTALTDLDLRSNNLSSIDLSKNTSLTKLYLGNNKISSIDLSKNTSLTSLHLDNNNLSSIKLYDNFDISGVSKTIGKQSAYQTSIDLGSNRIINLIKSYKYYYSSKIVIPSEVDIQTFINNLGLQNLTSKVFNNDEETSSGKVKEGYILKLYYEDTEVDSVPIKIFENSVFDDEFFYKAVVDAYNRENKTSLPYTTNLTDEQLKSIKIVSYWGNQKSDSEKIRSTTGIEKLTALTYLYLGWNNLSSIDLSKNTSLTDLDLISNRLSSIDLSKNTFLTYLYLENNELSNIDLSKNTKLTNLQLYNNPLKLNAYVKENGTLTSSSIKMPEGSDKFYLTYEIEDNSIANFADNRLNGLKVGKTSSTVTLNGVKASSSSTENMKVDGTITVFDRLKGDISNDDKITIADVSLLYRHVRGTKVIEDSKTLEISDLTGDGKITIADVAKLYRYVRGKITEL